MSDHTHCCDVCEERMACEVDGCEDPDRIPGLTCDDCTATIDAVLSEADAGDELG